MAEKNLCTAYWQVFIMKMSGLITMKLRLLPSTMYLAVGFTRELIDILRAKIRKHKFSQENSHLMYIVLDSAFENQYFQSKN